MADETTRLIDLSENNTADASTWLLTDSSSNGTNKIAATTLVDNTPVAFTSNDIATASATAWTDPGVMATGENRKTLLQKISTMVKNVKYLYNLIGNTDISAIGNGSVTGAISQLNTISYQYKGVLTSSDDLNNVKTRGFYAITTKPANAPTTYGSLIVTVSGETVYQTMIRSDYIYTRAYTGSPIAWTNWVQQPTRGEVDNLKTYAYQYRGGLSSSDDLNNVTTRGFYQITTQPTNSPVAWSSLMVSGGGETVYQTLFSSNFIYTRAYTGNPIAWTDWLKQPTRAEFDQLKSNLQITAIPSSVYKDLAVDFTVDDVRYSLQFYLDNDYEIVLLNASDNYKQVWGTSGVMSYRSGASASNTIFDGVTGFVTGSATMAWIYIPINTRPNVTSINVSSINLGLRVAAGGYLGGSDNFNATTYITETTVIRKQSIIVVKLQKNDGWGVPNNSSFCGRVTMSFTFS